METRRGGDEPTSSNVPRGWRANHVADGRASCRFPRAAARPKSDEMREMRHELVLAGGWTLPETFDRGGLIGICNHGKSGA